jgi:hypothetical protein
MTINAILRNLVRKEKSMVPTTDIQREFRELYANRVIPSFIPGEIRPSELKRINLLLANIPAITVGNILQVTVRDTVRCALPQVPLYRITPGSDFPFPEPYINYGMVFPRTNDSGDYLLESHIPFTTGIQKASKGEGFCTVSIRGTTFFNLIAKSVDVAERLLKIYPALCFMLRSSNGWDFDDAEMSQTITVEARLAFDDSGRYSIHAAQLIIKCEAAKTCLHDIDLGGTELSVASRIRRAMRP